MTSMWIIGQKSINDCDHYYTAIWSEQQRHRLEINISASHDRVSTKDPFLAALVLCDLS